MVRRGHGGECVERAERLVALHATTSVKLPVTQPVL
jgi:hypothetical protein